MRVNKSNLEVFHNLPKEEQDAVRKSFNIYLVKDGRCSSYNGVEDDYQYDTGKYYVYEKQFYIWIASYLSFKETSIETLLADTKELLCEEEGTESKPLGVTVDRFGFCYCLRDSDGVGLRSSSLEVLKDVWKFELTKAKATK